MKKRIIAFITGIALLAITGATGIVADYIGLDVTPHVAACDPEGSSGGGC
jgi:hypothetical protein